MYSRGVVMHAFPIAQSRNKKQVYAHLIQDPLAAGIARNPHLLTLVSEVIATLELHDAEVVIEQEMGREIGYSDQLETRDDDAIFYARTSKREPGFTRFVRLRNAERTSVLTFSIREDNDGNFELVDAWIGRAYPPTPDSAAKTLQSKEYWANHAIVYNGQSILTSTITKDCPYES